MDGRPHAPGYALHTWAGFSTGERESDTPARSNGVTVHPLSQPWRLLDGSCNCLWPSVSDDAFHSGGVLNLESRSADASIRL